MPDILETELDDFSKFVSYIETHFKTKSCWFRGVGDPSHKLLPSFYRHPKNPPQADCALLENRLIEAFKNRSLPFLESTSILEGDEWGLMFFMQHYRFPTRLLDWSVSPLISLYFALTSVGRNKKGTPETDVVIWVLDPIAWNREAQAYRTYTGGVISTSDKEISPKYLPKSVYETASIPPIAIHGPLNSPRIVAQRGVFTVFGPQATPMEDLFKAGDRFSAITLQKIIIPKKTIDDYMISLGSFGISESFIYPDLEGLSMELSREMGFKK